jgi:alpha-beta hydrolase superfamily lysophospholipase
MIRRRRLIRLAIRAGTALLLVLATIVVIRVWDLRDAPPLRAWHRFVPPEPAIAEMERADWAGWLAAEARVFEAMQSGVTAKLSPADRAVAIRYDPASPLHAPGFATDWNRSFVTLPQGPPRGAAVLLHGMTDAPFSMRHLARLYADSGFVAVVPRMPGHGTVPAGLTSAHWEDWAAATRIAVREARRRVPQGPLHLVGYSNGGALALLHALDAMDNPALHRPDRLVLVSPMVGVTAFARFAGLAGLPAFLPAFAEAAWLSVLPEFNPFKFNSFPVNAARQSHLLTAAVQARLRAAAGRLDLLPPVLTFQSVVDATVSTRAVVDGLYALLPDNGSELVLFDMNRGARLGLLLDPRTEAAVERLVPPAPRRFALTVVTNADPDGPAVEARRTPSGAAAPERRALGLAWPRGQFSLSHVALPFPDDDGLYGATPDPADGFGVQLGTLALRGERGVLVLDLDTLLRASSNPFFPYLRDRLAETIGGGFGMGGAAAGQGAHQAPPGGR